VRLGVVVLIGHGVASLSSAALQHNELAQRFQAENVALQQKGWKA
jgi:hypothetical protein